MKLRLVKLHCGLDGHVFLRGDRYAPKGLIAAMPRSVAKHAPCTAIALVEDAHELEWILCSLVATDRRNPSVLV
jgi:hypothetical protein